VVQWNDRFVRVGSTRPTAGIGYRNRAAVEVQIASDAETFGLLIAEAREHRYRALLDMFLLPRSENGTCIQLCFTSRRICQTSPVLSIRRKE
jgi:hypothetical protein